MENKKSEQSEVFEESVQENRDRNLFNTIAESYCQKDISASSSPPRKHRLLKTLSVIPEDQDIRVLEVGCGCGYSAKYLKGLYGNYVGVDYAEKLIDYAKKHNGGDETDFVAANIKEYSTEKRADVIIMVGVLHHFDDYPETFTTILKLLKPGGWILVNEPQSANVIIQAARKLRAVLDKSYSEDQLTFSGNGLKQLFENNGLEGCSITPQGFFSTPFAEVIFKPEPFFWLIAKASVLADKALEAVLGGFLKYFSWNLIVAGRKKR